MPSSISSASPGLIAAKISAMRQMHAGGVAGRGIGVEDELLALVEVGRVVLERAEPQLRPLQIDQDADRPAILGFDRADRRHELAHPVVAGVAHVDAKDVGAGREQAADHAPVAGRRPERRYDFGPPLPPHRPLLPGAGRAHRCGRRRVAPRWTAGWRRADCRPAAALRRLLAGFGELHRPGRLLAGIDLEKAGAVVAARQAIADAADGELLVARAHEGLPHPFAAAIIVDRVDVVITRDEIALEHGFAGAVPASSTSLPWSSPRASL